MSEFSEFRAEAFDVLRRMLDELGNKSTFGQYDAASLERLAKTCILLENQAGKTGQSTAFKDAPTEDLESDFE